MCDQLKMYGYTTKQVEGNALFQVIKKQGVGCSATTEPENIAASKCTLSFSMQQSFHSSMTTAITDVSKPRTF